MKNTNLIKKIVCGVSLISLPILASAGNCTESDIRSGVNAGGFSYKAKGCSNKDGIIKINNTIGISKSNGKVDGGGVMRLVWSGGGSCSEKEGGRPMFDLNGNNITLKGFSVEGAPDGIHISTGSNNVLDGIVFPKICEDAITNGNMRTNSATKTIIRNSSFANAADKAIQVNGGSIKITNSKFKNVDHPVTSCGVKANPGYHGPGKCPAPGYIVFVNNEVDTCGANYAVQSAGTAKSFVVAMNNNFVNCQSHYRSQGNGTTYSEGNSAHGKCTLAYNAYEKGLIQSCRDNTTAGCERVSTGNVRSVCRTQKDLETDLKWPGALNGIAAE